MPSHDEVDETEFDAQQSAIVSDNLAFLQGLQCFWNPWKCWNSFLKVKGPWVRYDTRCYFNVRSKANLSQLKLIYRTEVSVLENVWDLSEF